MQVLEIPLLDRYAIIFQSRIFSLGNTLEFEYNWGKLPNDKDDTVLYEQDLHEFLFSDYSKVPTEEELDAKPDAIPYYPQMEGIKDLQKQDEQKYGPGDYVPDVTSMFWAFRAMIAAGGLMFLVAIISLAMYRSGKLTESPAMLKVLFWMLPFPYIANATGWYVAEMGRQPWLVYGLQKTADGASRTVTAPETALL